jgi:hypothetical protein
VNETVLKNCRRKWFYLCFWEGVGMQFSAEVRVFVFFNGVLKHAEKKIDSVYPGKGLERTATVGRRYF